MIDTSLPSDYWTKANSHHNYTITEIKEMRRYKQLREEQKKLEVELDDDRLEIRRLKTLLKKQAARN